MMKQETNTLHSLPSRLNLAFCTPTGAQLADSISYSQYRKLIAQKDEVSIRTLFTTCIC